MMASLSKQTQACLGPEKTPEARSDPGDLRTSPRKRRPGVDGEWPKKKRGATVDGSGREKVSTGARAKKARGERESWKKRLCKETKASACNSCRRSLSATESSDIVLANENTSRDLFEANYVQLHWIAEGSFGCVYAGYRKQDHLPVAIKYIAGTNVMDEIQIYRMPLEVALMQRVAGGPESVGMGGPVALLDWYILDEGLILVMERPVPCMTLSDYIRSRGGTLEEDEAKVLLNQLVDAVTDMHQKCVFHRDIKCVNLLVENGSSIPHVRVIDFGCGTFVQEKPHRYFSGTLVYAPPEWFKRGEYRASPTTVWQLGAVLFNMLHGPVFNTMNFCKGRLGLCSELSQDCLDFLHRCLAVNPKKRSTLQDLAVHPWLNRCLQD